MRSIVSYSKCVLFLVILVVGLVACSERTPRTLEDALQAECPEEFSIQECEVQKRFASDLRNNIEQRVFEYREHFGNVLNTDNARELSKDYAPDGIGSVSADAVQARGMWSRATYGPASAFTRELYRRKLAADTIVFTAGGAASGKSTAIKSDLDVIKTINDSLMVFDTTLSRGEISRELIDEALNAGKRVTVVFVYRDPIEALVNGVIPRALENGRIVTISSLAGTHAGAMENIISLMQAYSSQSAFEVVVLDNTRGPSEAVTVEQGQVRQFLTDRQLTEDEIFEALRLELAKFYKNGINNNVLDRINR